MKVYIMNLLLLFCIFILSSCITNAENKDQTIYKALAVDNQHNYLSENIQFETTDGFIIKGKLYKPKNYNEKLENRVVILLHMLGKTRETYKPLISKLIDKNYEVLAIDFRGHGESVNLSNGEVKTFNKFNPADWAKLPVDVETAIAHLKSLKKLDKLELSIVGASIGANTAIIVSSKDKEVNKVVALSPGLDFKGLKPGDFIDKSKANILLVSSTGDKYSDDSINKLNSQYGDSEVLIYKNDSAHGTNLFLSQPELINKIVSFINK